MDPKTEIQIYEKMFEECEGKAIVSTLHRLHLLTYFDYVYILEEGVIVDQGSFTDLKTNSAIFRELWRHQEEKRAVN